MEFYTLASLVHEHRKTFELFGSKLQVPPSTECLSGLRFSSTVRAELSVRADGRPYIIQF